MKLRKHIISGYPVYRINDVRNYLRSSKGIKAIDSFDKFIRYLPGFDSDDEFYIFVKDYREWEKKGKSNYI